MKKLFTLLICLFYISTQAQQQKTVIRGGYGKTELTLGAGTTLPSSAIKTNNNMGNLTNFNLGIYVPILNYGGATGGVINLGFYVGGEYFTGNDAYNISNYKPFNITGQTGMPPITAKGTGSPKQQGFKTEGGAQANFSFGSYTISPILNLAFINLKQKAFTVVQNTTVNGQNYEHTLYSQAESKTSAIAVVAKLRHRYKFGRDSRFSIFAETNYLFGPSVTTASTYLTPEGAANAQGNYNLNQMNFGTQTSQTKSTKFNGFGVNAGINISLGNKNKKPAQKYNTENSTSVSLDAKLPLEVQKLIDAQEKSTINSFEYVKSKNNQKTSSLCNFNIEKVDINFNGNDAKGRKKYKITITYKNLASFGTASLGHYLTACTATPTNGNFIAPMPSGSAAISNLSPSNAVKTIIPPLGTQNITFDFVPDANFSSLNIKGNLINSATDCGNCDDIITLNLPNCCNACEENPVTAVNNSIKVIDNNLGTIKIDNTVSSSKNITRIQADLVSVKIYPNNTSCNKCNTEVKQQNNFIDANKLINNNGWANAGQSAPKPGYPFGASRSIAFNSATNNGVNISSGAQISHTIGIAPTSCCGDNVEIWIRYTVWDKDCKVCDKLVRTAIVRPAACNSHDGNGSTGNPSSSTQLSNINVKN